MWMNKRIGIVGFVAVAPKPQEIIVGARCWFVAYVKCLVFPKWHNGVFISSAKDLHKFQRCGRLCFSALCSGKWSTKWPDVAGQNTLRGRWIVKSRFARGKWDIWQSLVVWGLHHNSTPPITVFHWTTIASTIITWSQHSFSPWKPLWPQARRVVCSPGGGHYRLTRGDNGDCVPWGRTPLHWWSARCQLYMLWQCWVTPPSI